MHEVALMQGAVNTAVSSAESANATRVSRVHLTLGASSHMSADAARQHFAVLSAGTLAEGAELVISWLPATYQCFECLHRFDHVEVTETATCPICGGIALEIAHQDVCAVTAIDIDEAVATSIAD